MDQKAVNSLIKTPGGTLYHGGDSHYSNYYAKHGNDHEIDVALGACGKFVYCDRLGNQAS